jgi:hypothetical protein
VSRLLSGALTPVRFESDHTSSSRRRSEDHVDTGGHCDVGCSRQDGRADTILAIHITTAAVAPKDVPSFTWIIDDTAYNQALLHAHSMCVSTSIV